MFLSGTHTHNKYIVETAKTIDTMLLEHAYMYMTSCFLNVWENKFFCQIEE